MARQTGAVRSVDHDLVAFDEAPFPLAGNPDVPGTGQPFFDTDPDGRRFHMAPRGGKLYEDETYGDRRSLLSLPPDGRPPRALVLFLHGNRATLSRDVVGRQRVAEQVARSGLDAALVAPQLATDALDSSPGRFYEPGFVDRYLHEAAVRLAARSRGRLTAAGLDALPLILVAYSGGYLATAFALPEQSGTRRAIAGVILLDALFGEEAKFAQWVRNTHADAFFVSAFSPASAAPNAELDRDLRAAAIGVERALPAALRAGDVVLLATPRAAHDPYVTSAWTADPLTDVMARVRRGTQGDR